MLARQPTASDPSAEQVSASDAISGSGWRRTMTVVGKRGNRKDSNQLKDNAVRALRQRGNGGRELTSEELALPGHCGTLDDYAVATKFINVPPSPTLVSIARDESVALVVCGDRDLVLLDLTDVTVARRWTVGKGALQGVAPAGDGFWVCGPLPGLLRIRPDEAAPTPVAGFAAPVDVVADPMRSLAWVADIEGNAVVGVDADSGRPDRDITVSRPSRLAMSNHGDLLCRFTNSTGVEETAVLNPETGERRPLAWQPDPGTSFRAMAWHPDGHRIYTSCAGPQGGSVSMIDVNSGQVIRREPCGWPGHLTVHPSGRFLVAGDSDGFDNLRVVDADTLDADTLQVACSPEQTAFFADGNIALTCFSNEDVVALLPGNLDDPGLRLLRPSGDDDGATQTAIFGIADAPIGHAE